MKTGAIDLPLHPGKCPRWLFERMRPLAKAMSQIIIDEYGTAEYLRRLSDPLFFQSLSCVLGFDWHSSGTTTTTCGALKDAFSCDSDAPAALPIAACGGKGKTSRKAPAEIASYAEQFGLSDATISSLLEASRLAAKVDSSCVQDGYDLYHHSFFFDEKGNWAVVQQGMNDANHYARRYHWLQTRNFTDGPPENIAGIGGGKEANVLNLVSPETQEMRQHSVELVQDNPMHVRKYLTGQRMLFDDETTGANSSARSMQRLPSRHEILKCDLSEKDWAMLQQAYELQPQNYKELVSVRGMGKRKLRALALVSRLIYGSELDWNDPVKFSFAHGGKDGIPFPVDRPAYDNTISFLRDVVEGTCLASRDKEGALKRLAGLSF